MEMLLSCSGLAKYYGGLPALSDVSVNLYGGRITLLAGGHGAGKSALLRLAAGSELPTSGTITVCGIAPGTASNEFTAYLPDRDFLPPGEKLIDIVRLHSAFFSDFDAETAVALLAEENADMTKRFRNFSRSKRSVIQTVLTACRRARVFLLDEPARCPGAAALIRDYVSAGSAAVIAGPCIPPLTGNTDNDTDYVYDDILMLKNGTVTYCGEAAGLPAELEGRG